jgi:poly(3-hydroxybutyrate) depolymerase
VTQSHGSSLPPRRRLRRHEGPKIAGLPHDFAKLEGKAMPGLRMKLAQSAPQALAILARWLLTFCLMAGLASYAQAGKPICGDNICQGNEAKTCPADCESLPPPPSPPGVPSSGCGSADGPDARAGRTYVRQLVVGSNPVTNYELRLPNNYDVNAPGGLPVLMYLHGWGGSHRSLPTRFARHGKDNGYIIVTPTGYGDGGRNSWNGFRSARLPDCPTDEITGVPKEGYGAADCDAGPLLGASPPAPSTCVDLDNVRHNYCYESNQDHEGNCPKWNGEQADNTWGAEFNGDYTCYWTTGLDSVGQIEALLNEIEQDYCIDRSMIWVTGCSNGGMFVYELAKDKRTAARFAGYMPQVGAPHPGFQQFSPASSVPPGKFFMGFWGTRDNTVPGRSNFPELFGEDVALDTSFNGWLYMTARSITSYWAEANSFTDSSGVVSPQPYDASGYSSSLECVSWHRPDDGSEAEIVECFFDGGHSCPGFSRMPQMMWNFARAHPNANVP